MACNQPGMTDTGYSALEAKNSGIMIAWPMPIIRSRLSTRPAIVMDRQQKNAAPTMSTTAVRSRRRDRLDLGERLAKDDQPQRGLDCAGDQLRAVAAQLLQVHKAQGPGAAGQEP